MSPIAVFRTMSLTKKHMVDQNSRNEGKNAWRQHRDAGHHVRDAVVSAPANSQYRAGIGDYQPKPEAALPLYSHCRVSSSVHPGTANRGVGAVTRWTGRK
jgi:hypothetical protein